MNLPGIVCPDDKALLGSFNGRSVAVRVGNLARAPGAAADVLGSGNSLHCVIVETDAPLDAIEAPENAKGIPLALIVPSMGKFRGLAPGLACLRELDARIYLRCDNPENITALRVLASVGIHGCAIFGKSPNHWEKLADLMTWAVLGFAPHASIEPFETIVSHYNPHSCLRWGRVWFDDPQCFLYLDERGRVALSRPELEQGNFIAGSISEIGDPPRFPAIKSSVLDWQRFFLQNHPCSVCPGWKICLGRFHSQSAENQGCSAFFIEMLDVARQYAKIKTPVEERHIWQP